MSSSNHTTNKRLSSSLPKIRKFDKCLLRQSLYLVYAIIHFFIYYYIPICMIPMYLFQYCLSWDYNFTLILMFNTWLFLSETTNLPLIHSPNIKPKVTVPTEDIHITKALTQSSNQTKCNSTSLFIPLVTSYNNSLQC